MNIRIYSKTNCPNCSTAKRLLDDKGIGYNEFDAEAMTHAALKELGL